MKPKTNNLQTVLHYTKKGLGLVVKTGVPQVVFEGLKDLGIMAVVVIDAEAGIETAGNLSPVFNLFSERGTRLAIALVGTSIGVTLEILHQLLRLVPKNLKSNLIAWPDKKATELRTSFFESLYAGAMSFHFCNDIFLMFLGDTPATVLSGLSAGAMGLWTLCTYNKNIGTQSAEIDLLVRKIIGEKIPLGIKEKVIQKIASKIPQPPDTVKQPIAQAKSFVSNSIKQPWHAYQLAFWGLFNVNLLKLILLLSAVDCPIVFYALSGIVFISMFFSSLFTNRFYPTRFKINNTKPENLTLKKQLKYLQRIFSSWRLETCLFNAPTYFTQDALRSYLGIMFTYIAIVQILAIVFGINKQNDTENVQLNGYWINIVAASLAVIITFFTTFGFINNSAPTIRKLQDSIAKTKEENDTENVQLNGYSINIVAASLAVIITFFTTFGFINNSAPTIRKLQDYIAKTKEEIANDIEAPPEKLQTPAAPSTYSRIKSVLAEVPVLSMFFSKPAEHPTRTTIQVEFELEERLAEKDSEKSEAASDSDFYLDSVPPSQNGSPEKDRSILKTKREEMETPLLEGYEKDGEEKSYLESDDSFTSQNS